MVESRTPSMYAPPAPIREDWNATARQAQVIRLIGDGLTVAAVARELRIAESTVHDHLETIAYALTNPDGLAKRDLVFLYANHCRWLAALANRTDVQKAG